MTQESGAVARVVCFVCFGAFGLVYYARECELSGGADNRPRAHM